MFHHRFLMGSYIRFCIYRKNSNRHLTAQWRRPGILIVNFEHISHNVSIISFEHVIADWVLYRLS